jgi:hypothetical protein
MFADKIGENCSTVGTGTFSLGGAADAFRAWSTGFATGADAFYYATNTTGTIWEIGYGTFTDSTPDTLSRNLIASSSGALINWTSAFKVYSIPNAAALKHNLAPLINGIGNLPAWLPAGATWLDYALGAAVAWVKKRYISGTRATAANHAEEGRFHLTGGINIFAASQRSLFVDKGAASYAFAADDIGKVLAFDCTAAVRVLTMLANSAAGMGHGAYVFVYPYGSTVNGVTFTPGGADTTALATAPANRITKFIWDGARAKWVADYVAPIGASQADQETSTNALNFVSPSVQQYHPSACKAWLKADQNGAIQASYNMTSVTDVTTGVVGVTINVDFSSAHWACAITHDGGSFGLCDSIDTQAAGSFRILIGNTVTQGPQDATYVHAVCFGDQ